MQEYTFINYQTIVQLDWPFLSRIHCIYTVWVTLWRGNDRYNQSLAWVNIRYQYSLETGHWVWDFEPAGDVSWSDPLVLFEDVMQDVELLPALRISGELARWNGNTTSQQVHLQTKNKTKRFVAKDHRLLTCSVCVQGEVGVSVCLTFETLVGESTSSHLELKNEGTTAIYYSWQKVELTNSFPEARPPKHTQKFYFNTATGKHTHTLWNKSNSMRPWAPSAFQWAFEGA